METTVRYTAGVRFEVHARQHVVVCDQPTENGGQDAGITPPEFLLASLGTCAAFYAVQYLRTRGLSAEGVTARVTADKIPQPARLGNFVITIDVPGLTDQKHRDGVIRAAKNCLIHNTLLHPPAMELVLA